MHGIYVSTYFGITILGPQDNYKQNMFNLPQADNTDLKIIYKVDTFSDSMGLSLWTFNRINSGMSNQWKSMIGSVINQSTYN